MVEVTHLFDTYRECVRHLWNVYFRPIAEPQQDWDVRDEFDLVARGIFSSIVLGELEIFDCGLSPENSAAPSVLPGIHIIPSIEHGTPILINRDLPRSGYWDHPVQEVLPNEIELQLLRYFDFAELGYREYRYFEVFINSASNPVIVGRVALIEVENAKVMFSKPAV